MGKVIGIDLGTTNPARHHERWRPGCHRQCGRKSDHSRQWWVSRIRMSAWWDKSPNGKPSRILKHHLPVKRLMGRKFKSKEVQEAMKRLPHKVVEADNGDAHVELRGKRYSPPEVSAMILQKMRQTAEDYLGEKVTKPW